MKEYSIPRLIFFFLLGTTTLCAIFTFFFFKPLFYKLDPLTFLEYLWFISTTILGLIIIFFIGYTLLYFLPSNNEFPPLVKCALSYGLGTGFLSLSMFLSILMGLHSRLSFLPILILLIFLFIFFKIYINLKGDINEIVKTIKRQRFNKVEYFCLFLLIIELIYLFSHWFIYPIYRWDGLYIWNLRAKLLFYRGDFNFLNKLNRQNYPLLVPLNLCFFYSLYLTEYHFAKILILFYFISLLIFLYYSLRSFKLSRTYSILITTLFAIVGETFEMATSVLADFPFTFFYTISTIFIFFYFKTKKQYYLIYSSIFMGLMAWTKWEGLYLFFVNILILTLYLLFQYRKNMIIPNDVLKNFLSSFFLGFIIFLPWLLFVILNRYPSMYLGHVLDIFNFRRTLRRISIISISGFILIIHPYNWGIVFWIVIVFFIILNFKVLFKEDNFFLFLLVFIHFLVYIYVYMVTPLPAEFHVYTSFDRMLLHITPISCFLIGILIFDNNRMVVNIEDDSLFNYLIYIFAIFMVIYLIIINLFFKPIFNFVRDIFPYYGIQSELHPINQ